MFIYVPFLDATRVCPNIQNRKHPGIIFTFTLPSLQQKPFQLHSRCHRSSDLYHRTIPGQNILSLIFLRYFHTPSQRKTIPSFSVESAAEECVLLGALQKSLRQMDSRFLSLSVHTHTHSQDADGDDDGRTCLTHARIEVMSAS